MLEGSPLTEQLADYAHQAWSGWMQYLFELSQKNEAGGVVIPPALVARWKRQMATKYVDLPETEKLSDRAEAKKMLDIFHAAPKPDVN